ncbi:MAG: hypothetical protein BJ554DRAFT_877, partial [Olpidium bornovanus]
RPSRTQLYWKVRELVLAEVKPLAAHKHFDGTLDLLGLRIAHEGQRLNNSNPGMCNVESLRGSLYPPVPAAVRRKTLSAVARLWNPRRSEVVRFIPNGRRGASAFAGPDSAGFVERLERRGLSKLDYRRATGPTRIRWGGGDFAVVMSSVVRGIKALLYGPLPAGQTWIPPPTWTNFGPQAWGHTAVPNGAEIRRPLEPLHCPAGGHAAGTGMRGHQWKTPFPAAGKSRRANYRALGRCETKLSDTPTRPAASREIPTTLRGSTDADEQQNRPYGLDSSISHHLKPRSALRRWAVRYAGTKRDRFPEQRYAETHLRKLPSVNKSL